jgi:hypothetical protein
MNQYTSSKVTKTKRCLPSKHKSSVQATSATKKKKKKNGSCAQWGVGIKAQACWLVEWFKW